MKRLTTLLCLAMSLLLTFSCGIMDMDEEFVVEPIDIDIDQDTLYVMKGESFTIRPVFHPDNVSLDDIFWTVDDESCVFVSNNIFTAVGEGWTVVRGMSVANQFEDSCSVCVLDWNAQLPAYPYETVIYADVKVDGENFDPATMSLGAFISDRLAGVGKLRSFKGINYMEIRAGSEWIDESDDNSQTITFRIYDNRSHTCREMTEEIVFDCGTYGTVSNLYQLNLMTE